MIDSITHEPIKVSVDGTAGPYIMVPVDQLDQVTELLDNNEIPYWVDADAISIEGEPEITVINLDQRADVPRLQRLLNNAD